MPEKNLHNHGSFPFSLNNVDIETIIGDLITSKNVKLSVLRLDKIHPLVSGNKLFKLRYYIEEAMQTNQQLLTFGGAYSNHLASTAWLCKKLNIQCIGIVRGERSTTLSHTLKFCTSMGMQLHFVSRSDYKSKGDPAFMQRITESFGDAIVIPEGGSGEKGMSGASNITSYFSAENYSHICTAVGTGTTMFGIRKSTHEQCEVLGFNVLKTNYTEGPVGHNLKIDAALNNCKLIDDYHFGGYAKYTPELISFMNGLFINHNIQTDFVYTAKMFFGVLDLIKKNYFPFNSNILCIHTGGLQGNLSLPIDTLAF